MKAIIIALAMSMAAAASAFAGGERPTDIKENMGGDGLPIWVHPHATQTIQSIGSYDAEIPSRMLNERSVRIVKDQQVRVKSPRSPDHDH